MKLPDPHERPVLQVDEVAALFGKSPDQVYRHVRRGEWPTPVLRLGRSIRLPTRPILKALGMFEPDE